MTVRQVEPAPSTEGGSGERPAFVRHLRATSRPEMDPKLDMYSDSEDEEQAILVNKLLTIKVNA